MARILIRSVMFVIAVIGGVAVPASCVGGWRAGAASAVITPRDALWMSGYAARDRPADGKATDLWAKALVLEDDRGRSGIIVTLDLVGIDRETSLAIREELAERYRLTLADVVVFTSHTHCGPVFGNNLRSMYALDDAQWALIDEYTQSVSATILRVVAEAVTSLAPAELAWGTGQATFAVNRRENRDADVAQLRAQGMLRGPVDHDVPVLRVTSGGKISAIVCGYACHATTLDIYQWCGDYPAFAMLELERRYPGATVLFFAGCGADQNPLPRRSVELAESYGQQLAEGVDEVLKSNNLRPLAPALRTAYAELDLPFAHLPDLKELKESTRSSNRSEVSRARLLLQHLDREGELSEVYPDPVETWRLGDLTWVMLGGETVVDYSLRLKLETQADFVASYANDVMAYIPSERVLKEGGYEGGSAMLYYGLPSPWSAGLEDRIVREVARQIGLLAP